MGRYLNQTSQEEPRNFSVKRGQTGKVSNKQQTDGRAREVEDDKQQERRGSTAQGRCLTR